jgi:hypothetical protein
MPALSAAPSDFLPQGLLSQSVVLVPDLGLKPYQPHGCSSLSERLLR